jgi:short-subunit dehydrogenase
MECNSTACVKVTHHFLKLMLEKNLKGCIVFTSSVSGYIPNPFAVMYGATKAFVSQFAASLAIEVRNAGIDVLAVHPSPVNSKFFEKAHKLDSLEMAQKSAVSPDEVPAKILTCIGRCHLGDLGGMALGVRAGIAFIPYDFLTGIFAFFAPYMPDYQKHNKNRGKTA